MRDLIRKFPAGYLRARLWPLCAAVVGLAALAGCEWKWSGSAKAAGPPPKPPSRQFPVDVQQVSVMPLKYQIQALGSVEAQDVYQVHALVPGTLYDVNFNEGDTVKKDQVLCRIAPLAYEFMAQKAEGISKNAVAELENMKRKMKFEVERSKEKLEEAKHEFGRRKDIGHLGGISDEELALYLSKRELARIDLDDMTKATETEIKMLEASVLEKDAAWKIALDDVRKSIILPPITGIIEKRAVTNGMYVTAGTLLATIVDRSTLKVKLKLSEKDSGAVSPGNEVSFQVPAWPGREFKAEVYFMSNQLDKETRTVDCYARVTKDAEKLKPGYFASAQMETGGNERAVVVPSMAVLPTEKGFVAFVIKDGKAEKRYLKTGMTVTDNSLEVLSGVKENEMLVVNGANALDEGSEVKILKEVPPYSSPNKGVKKEGVVSEANTEGVAPVKATGPKATE